MKGLKKLAIVSAIAAAPFAVQADMKALDDSAMGDVTGQAGVSIELGAAVTVGEIAYKDEGFLAINNLKLAGADMATNADSRLDNILMKIDVAGTDNAALTTQWGLNALGGDPNVNTVTPAIEDGDLVIHLGTQGTVTGAADLLTPDNGISVDWGLSIDSVGLAKSVGSTVGSLATQQGTVLVSDLALTGFLGPIDIVIQEEVAADTQVMNINAYFTANGTITADFVGTTFDLAIGNSRQSATGEAGAFPFAHVQLDIGTRQDSNGDTDGLVVNVQDFSADIDMTDITFGAAAGRAAIGDLYMTDVAVKAEMVVYGHE